jgi:hypothetical protein
MKCRIKCRMSSVVSDVGLNKHLRKMVIEKVQFPSVKEHFQAGNRSDRNAPERRSGSFFDDRNAVPVPFYKIILACTASFFISYNLLCAHVELSPSHAESMYIHIGKPSVSFSFWMTPLIYSANYIFISKLK